MNLGQLQKKFDIKLNGSLNIVGEVHISQSKNSVVHQSSIEKMRKSLITQERTSMLERRQHQMMALEEKRKKYFEQERDNFISMKIQREISILEESKEITDSETLEINTRRDSQREERYQHVVDLRHDYVKKRAGVLFDSVLQSQALFKQAHQRAVEHFMAIDKDKMKDFEECTKNMKSLISGFECIISKIKMGDLSPEDVKIAEHLYLNMDKLEKNLELEMQKLNEPEKQNIHLTKEETPVIIEQTIAASKVNEHQHVLPTTDVAFGFASPESFNWYSAVMTVLGRKESIIKQFNSEENYKKYRSNLKTIISISVNTITAVSPHHMKDKFVKLFELLVGNVIQTADGPISASEHSSGKDYCMVILAEKFLSQCCSNKKAMFPIASIVISLWQSFPEFGMVFLACMYKACPYLVPYFPPRFEGQSAEEYYKVRGYRISEGIFESRDTYLDRQSCIARFFAAIIIAEPQNNGNQNSFGIENGWRWLCDILNLEPLPDACVMIESFLQIAGFEMWKIYKQQFTKILQLIKHQYFPKLHQTEEDGGRISRLEIFLDKSLKDGIEKPTESLPKNFF